MKYPRAMRLALAAILLAVVPGLAAAQQAYPTKPIRFIVPYAAGGAVSVLARLVGDKLNAAWGQPVVVDTRPGGGTIIGADLAAKAAPDGYTVILVASTHVTLPFLYENVPFDAMKDFAPVTTLASGEQILIVHPSVPAANLREFIALARSKPGQLNYASSGAGSPTNLAGELFNMMAGVKIQHIAYKGAAPAITDLIGGQVQMSFQNLQVALPHVKSGRARALAVSGDARSPAAPEVPTFAEAGLPGFDAKFWFGVLAPARTPKEIVDKLAAEMAKAVEAPDVKANLVSQGLEPYPTSPERMSALMKADMERYGKVIKAANIRVGN